MWDSAVWSPDGEYLAYVTEQTGSRGPGFYHRPLHILHLKTREEREPAGESEVRAPRWSPDGCSILVTGYDNNKSNQKDYNGGGVYKIDVQDGHVTELVQFHPVQDFLRDVWWNRSMADWSHDGRAVFYVNRGRILMRELESSQEKQLYQNNNKKKRVADFLIQAPRSCMYHLPLCSSRYLNPHKMVFSGISSPCTPHRGLIPVAVTAEFRLFRKG